MSYILEALKKSDQKRQKGQVPDINTVQEDLKPEERKKPLWPYFLIGILLLNGAIFAFIFLPEESSIEPQNGAQNADTLNSSLDQGKKDDIELQPAQVLSPEINANKTAPVVAKIEKDKTMSQSEKPPLATKELLTESSEIIEPQVEGRISESAGDVTGKSLEETQLLPVQRSAVGSSDEVAMDISREMDVQGSLNPKGAEHAVLDEPGVERGIAESEDIASGSEHILVTPKVPVVAAKQEPMEIQAVPDEEVKESMMHVSEKDQPTTSERSAPSESENKLKKEPLHLMQLPLSVQKELPEIHISGHVYFVKKPASRLASINGQIVREGYSITPDLKVEEITSDGVIFSYGKYRFYVPVF
jgi:hypothetical protein